MDVGSDDGRSQQPQVVIPVEAQMLSAYGARYLPLKTGSKQPQDGGNGRTNAVPFEDFFKLDEQNYGIALDGWAVVIDLDRPDCDTARFLVKRMSETPTWRQKTRKGQHWLYLLPPGLQLRGGNLHDGNGDVYGQVLCRAYIVGPGSRIDGKVSYQLEDGRAPVVAPDWLIEHARSEAKSALPGASANRRDRIPAGERDNALSSILAQMARSHAGLSEKALIIAAQAMIKAGLIEDGEEYLRNDPGALTRLAKSAVSFGDRRPEVEGIAMLPDEWRSGDDVETAPMPVDWLIPGYVPAAGLSILYGDGKVGKTSLMAWLAARITQGGKGVIYIGSGETTFDEFVRMVALYSGSDTSMIYEYPAPEMFNLPSKCVELEKALEVLGDGIKAILIDAIYSHFEPTPGMHEASRARFAMKPLNEVATRKKIAVLATIHENAAGGMLGSREMRNVARSVIHAIRKGASPLTIYGAGANVPQVDYGVTFEGEARPVLDGAGHPLTYLDLFNEPVTQTVYKLALGEKVAAEGEPTTVGVDDAHPGVDLDDIPEPKPQKKRRASRAS